MRGVLTTLSNRAEILEVLEQMVRNDDREVLNGRRFYRYQPEHKARWEGHLHRRAWTLRELQKDPPPSADSGD
ncbi:MAG TPA: hypothetical protein VGL72_26875 [Bryobacteraceae bacterium]|jgi:hypothetical protein